MLPRRFEVHLTRDDYVVGIAAVLNRLAREDRVRPKLLAARFVLILAIMAVLFAFFPASLPGVLAAALLSWLGEMVFAARFKSNQLGITFDPASSADTVVTLDDAGVGEVASNRSRHWSWPAVRALHSTPGYLIIEMASWEAIVLPDALWERAEDKTAFAAELRANWPHIEAAEEGVPSERATQTQVRLIEAVLIGRIALCLLAYQAAFEASVAMARSPVEATTALLWIGAGLAAAIVTWFVTGAIFRALARRSPQAALIAAWACFGLLALLLAVTWFF